MDINLLVVGLTLCSLGSIDFLALEETTLLKQKKLLPLSSLERAICSKLPRMGLGNFQVRLKLFPSLQIYLFIESTKQT